MKSMKDDIKQLLANHNQRKTSIDIVEHFIKINTEFLRFTLKTTNIFF